ncbi:Uu.00g099930.m01.CDS01 [Anthostomella pinea]|uniref:Beta-galactosidase n=1 Tax=Anthostomella pinea TaxID=933095 RepID=A0AAI8VCR6_9PEZI|nr:Uu.00g099930.m01.CDS01 [Anthostomella pinea]
MRWCICLAGLFSALASSARASDTPSSTVSAAAAEFTYDNNSFYLNGDSYVIIGGQMDPQRIPPVYWRDRLAKARAMGLNTIFSYVYWNLLEPSQGQWLSSEAGNDIARYFQIAHEEGLNVVLRPGPYICGEREWGGFPAWLSQVSGMQVRTFNGPFMAAAQSYLERLADDVRASQVTRGGPLLMVQVENEYGSYGENHNYTQALRDILLANFDVPLYTNDGGVNWTLAGGEVPGVLAEVDGDPRSGFAARDAYITSPTELGPLMDGEYYTFAPDFWGAANAHNTTTNQPAQVEQFVADLDYVLRANNSISLYMVHGGTNFAFSNGAIWKNFTAAFTTSYDYGAPLDESGRTTELYYVLREAIQKYVPAGSIPEPPADVPRLAIANFTAVPMVALFDALGTRTTSTQPMTMEVLGQAYGLILYEHTVTVNTTTSNTTTLSGVLQPGDRARDRVLVYVNGARSGVIDSTYPTPAAVTVSLKRGDKLQLLVENLGRVDYWSRESGTFVALEDPFKGIRGDVTVGGTVVSGWDIYSLPLDAPPPAVVFSNATLGGVAVGSPPVFYCATFRVEGDSATDPAALDTFLAVPDGVKGNVWVNRFNLGRYWVIGPQQSLYLPGTVLKAGAENEVVVLELEPNAGNLTLFGAAEREWGNNPDPDYP